MSEQTVRKCDRCDRAITAPPYLPVTLHAHHPRKLDLCASCATGLRTWLNTPPDTTVAA